ncbi:hypothetical protein BBJ28_00020408, partial [Nothophytophthora sp. Chile5]
MHEGTRPWKRPSWRRSMPLEERRVRSPLGDTPPREALGANWRSAQCVTSLYDAFVQLQQENEALREDARRAKQEVALQSNQDKLRQPEDTRCEQFEQEIRLLRSEKLRLEQTHRQQLAALETRASTSETTHRQLLAKYQERFALDPLEAKRSALAVKTMQNTLHNTLLEKEELAIRYGELKDLYRRSQHEQTQMVQSLRDKVQTFEKQRKRIGQQRVVNALAVWSTSRMERAWQQWSAVTRQYRQQEQHKQLTSSLEHQTDEKIARIQSSQAAVLIGMLLQRTARRTFTQWKHLARTKAERRRKGVRFTEEHSRRTLQRIVNGWKAEVLKAKDHAMAVTKLRRLLNGHKRRGGMRKWRVWVYRSALTEKTREVEELRRVMTQQTSKFEAMKSALEATQMESKEVVALHLAEKARYDADIQLQRATELAILQKLGRFFTKRSDRQLLRQLIGHWRQTATHQRKMNDRAALVVSKLKIIKTQRAVRQLQILQTAQREELTILKQAAAQMERKLLDAVVGHDESKTKMQFLTECGLVAKVFNALKLKVSVRRYQRHATLLCQKNAQRRQVAALLSHWRAFSQSRQAVNCRVAEKVNRLRDAFVRSLLLQWRFIAYEQRIVKQKQLKLRRRAQSRLVKKSFSEWQRTIHRDVRLAILLGKAEATVRRLNLKSSLMRWHEICVMQKQRDIQAMEKSKRIMQFLMGKHEAKLINAFHSWQELTRARRKIRDQAHAQCNEKQRALNEVYEFAGSRQDPDQSDGGQRSVDNLHALERAALPLAKTLQSTCDGGVDQPEKTTKARVLGLE